MFRLNRESEQGNWERFDPLQNVTKLQLYFIVSARGTAATFKHIKHADVWFQISILFISYAMCSNILTSQGRRGKYGNTIKNNETAQLRPTPTGPDAQYIAHIHTWLYYMHLECIYKL